MPEYRVIGQRVARPDALSRVTGEAVFTDDISLPGMLHAAAVRCPHPAARVRSVRTDAAEALEGVCAVLTPQSCALLPDRVRHAGQMVACVSLVEWRCVLKAAQLPLLRSVAWARFPPPPITDS